MRAARRWFFSEFDPKSGREIVALLLSGEKASAYYRMVTSHWEVSAALVHNKGADEQMFVVAHSEHRFVFAKLQPFLQSVREPIGEPDYLGHLEKLVMKVPDIEKKIENRRQLLASWAKAGAAAAAGQHE